jgi:hypothetical protein
MSMQGSNVNIYILNAQYNTEWNGESKNPNANIENSLISGASIITE